MLPFRLAKACPVTTRSSQKGARVCIGDENVADRSFVHCTCVFAVLKVIQPLVQAWKPETTLPRYWNVVPARLTVVLVLSSPLVGLCQPA